MKFIIDDSVQLFLEHAGSLLYQDEPTNSLMLGLCGNIQRASEPPKEKPVFIRILSSGQTVTAAIQTPPMPFVLTYAKIEELEFLANNLIQLGMRVPGIVGPAKEAEALSNIWARLATQTPKLGMGQKIYKIEMVLKPNSIGNLRKAQEDEVDLIAQWLVEFGHESLPAPERKTFEERLPFAARSIANQLTYVWTIDDKPVSMAFVGRPTQNGISVSAVYTPKDLRKNGYASALVANLSQKMLDSGKAFCVLYTDLTNPTSNKIYQNVGYKEVSDSKHFLFEMNNVQSNKI